MPLFRFHRGGLHESLQTTVIVDNMNELMDVIKTAHEDWLPPNSEAFGIIIGPYPGEGENFDRRIGWYTQLVTSDIHQKGIFVPEGYLSEPLRR